MSEDIRRKKEYLRSYRESIATEHELNSQINKLRNEYAFPKSQDLNGMPHGSGAERDLSDYAAKIDELLHDLKKAIDYRILLRREIMTRIESMNNETEKAILMKRYISGLTFEKIAVDLHYTWRWVLHLHGEALEHFPYSS